MAPSSCCEPFQSCITGGRAEHQSRQSLCSNFNKGWRFWRAARTDIRRRSNPIFRSFNCMTLSREAVRVGGGRVLRRHSGPLRGSPGGLMQGGQGGGCDQAREVQGQNPVPSFHGKRGEGRKWLDGHRAGTIDHHRHERRRLSQGMA